jgi:formate--tetrahydrofolate ligase
MRSIVEVGADLGMAPDQLLPYGRGVAKVDLGPEAPPNGSRSRGRLILVTAITPGSKGEGKTVTSIALGMALHREGVRAIPCLRQPSIGPVFGVKGGATGGGRASLEPADRINLGLTGDLHAVASAQNLLAAMVDNHLHHGNPLDLDPAAVEVPRTLDLGDRALRAVRVGAGPTVGPERADRFVIAAASESAAIHQLATGPEDLTARFERMLAGWTKAGRPVTARDLGASGAMAALLADARLPNLVQTSEGTPALVHAGPFANLGTGTASVVSIRLALARADFAIVEAGFAADLGAEKFIDLVGPVGGFHPDAAVLVATIEGLRHHGREAGASAGDRVAEIGRGLGNLDRHRGILQELGVKAVVGLNRQPTDAASEIALVRRHVETTGGIFALSTAYADGAAGAAELAQLVAELAERGSTVSPTSPDGTPYRQRLETIARRIYRADAVQFHPTAEAATVMLESAGLGTAPVCVAKTPLSLTDDPRRLGAPTHFDVTVRNLRAWTGAGLALAELGSVLAMPGLPEHPNAERIHLNAAGRVQGLE